MVSLDNLSDKQNLLLTQLSYESDVLKDNFKSGMSIDDILKVIPKGSTYNTLVDLQKAGLGSIRIKDVGNDSLSGFGAIAFIDDCGNTGFTFRGTDGISLESLNDWGDNITSMLTGTSVQTAQAEAFFDANRDPNGYNYLYGHSKGGELSESVLVNNYQYIKRVHLLNPQPLNPYTLTPDQRAAITSNKVDIVIVEGDYVWFLGKLPSYGNIRIAKSNGGNSHLYSSISNMFDESGNIQQGNQPSWEYPAYFGITIITSGLQIIGGGIGFIYNCTERIVDFTRNKLIPAAKDFIAAVASAFERFGDRVRAYVDHLKDFLGSVINKASSWYRNNFNTGYQYANAHPQITLDTYKLRTYAQRIQSVNQRIIALDSRLDGLYWQVGLLDLWNLMQADLLTGFSWRLLRCSGYLNDTANDFDSVENNLISNL